MVHPGFVTEWNQPSPNIGGAAWELRQHGYLTSFINHKTAIMIEYSDETGVSFPPLLKLLRTLIYPTVGSVLIISKRSGKHGVVKRGRKFKWS